MGGIKFHQQKSFSGISNLELFEWLLEKEKKRSLRTGGCVCVLMFDFSKTYRNDRAVCSNITTNRHWSRIVRLIQSNVRGSDFVFKIEDQMRIILTNTHKEGAYKVTRRLVKLAQSHRPGLNFLDGNARLSFNVRVVVWDYTAKMKYTAAFLPNKWEIEPWKQRSMKL